MFGDIDLVPSNEAGLILGTSPLTRSGGPNPFFQGRIHAGARLYHEGKVKYLLVSGTATPPYYDETRAMTNALIEFGVSPTAILIDTKGFDTFRSFQRSQDFFPEQRLTIVTQKFHAPRALYLAHAFNFDAVSFYAEDVPGIAGLSIGFREVFARVKAVIDVTYLRLAHAFSNNRVLNWLSFV